jgi:CRP-like cAMP-binding protein
MKKNYKEQNIITLDQLRRLEPVASLSNERLEELIPLVYVEQLVIGGNIFREGDIDNQTVYLLKGDVQLASSDGKINKTLSGKDTDAHHPLDDSQPRQATCSALTRVDILRIDNSVLDYMMMWDQLAVSESTAASAQNKEKATDKVSGEQSEIKTIPVDIPEPKVTGQQESVNQPSGNTEEKVDEPPFVVDDKAGNKLAEENQNNSKVNIKVKHTEVIKKETVSQNSHQAKDEVSTEKSEVHAASVVKLTDHSTEEIKDDSDRSWIRKMRHIMAFKSMPPANIKRLLECMESVEVSKGETIVKQGTPGDYYYVLTEGKAVVTRLVELATLEPGRSFGEEALISDDIRNASVTMETDGVVMRLSKKDFSQLLEEPLLHRLSPGDARIHIANGAVWLDVRHAREYQHSHLPEAINIPLHELRTRLDELKPETSVICYCSTGRRSAAAAFLLAQNGFKASVLNGGVRVMAQDLKRFE